jgi:hypothetical protein
MNDLYATVPIDGTRNEIRLIKIEPEDESRLIRCTLRTYALNDERLSYIALSYTWGPKERPRIVYQIQRRDCFT